MDNNKLTQPIEIANAFNDYFASIGTEMAEGGHLSWPMPRVENWPTQRVVNWPTPRVVNWPTLFSRAMDTGHNGM